MRIRISPKHGLNPAIPVCFFCNQPKDEIVFAGKIDKKDSEMPKYVVMDYQPCKKCKEQMSKGITFIGVATKASFENQQPIQGNFYPTGRYAVIAEEALDHIVNNEALRENIRKTRVTIIDDELLSSMLPSEDEESDFKPASDKDALVQPDQP